MQTLMQKDFVHVTIWLGEMLEETLVGQPQAKVLYLEDVQVTLKLMNRLILVHLSVYAKQTTNQIILVIVFVRIDWLDHQQKLLK